MNTVDKILDGSTDAVFELYEDIVFETEIFRIRHSNSKVVDPRLLSDLTCLVLKFGRSSEMVAALIEDQYGVQRSLTAFWFASQITTCVDVINDICRDVDGRARSVEDAMRMSAGDEALCWTEDFSMAQPDSVRVELKFGTPTSV